MLKSNWRPVPGYPDIEVSDHLAFRSVAKVTAYLRPSGTVSHRSFPAKVLKVQWAHPDGYATVFVNSRRMPIGAHVLVCLAFHGLPPEGKPFALHWDGDPTNFTPENIYWGSAYDNTQDSIRHGTFALGKGAQGGSKGHAAPNKKLTNDQVAFIRARCMVGDLLLGYKPLAREFGVNPTTIRAAHRGLTFTGI